MLADFKKFILRGNVIDLAVGVVIGAAFGAIVTSLVKDLITPLLSLVNLPDFSNAVAHVGRKGTEVRYGMFVNAIISFIVISAVIFFFVVKPLNRLFGRDADEVKPKNRECPYCLSSIPVAATVCAFCTRDVDAAA
jgi:large conductance mechanosensitive channel